MAEALWALRPPGEHAVEFAPRMVHRSAQERLVRAVQEKVTDGYQIESQGDSQTVLVKRPQRWLGVTMPGRTRRTIVSLDKRGYPTVRTP